MNKLMIRFLAVIIGALPATQKVFAKAERSIRDLNNASRDRLPHDGVFILDEAGQFKTIGTKDDIANLVERNKQLERQLQEAWVTAPSCE